MHLIIFKNYLIFSGGSKKNKSGIKQVENAGNITQKMYCTHIEENSRRRFEVRSVDNLQHCFAPIRAKELQSCGSRHH